jgi:hypothetical protein
MDKVIGLMSSSDQTSEKFDYSKYLQCISLNNKTQRLDEVSNGDSDFLFENYSKPEGTRTINLKLNNIKHPSETTHIDSEPNKQNGTGLDQKRTKKMTIIAAKSMIEQSPRALAR